jgi:hypothetical protein
MRTDFKLACTINGHSHHTRIYSKQKLSPCTLYKVSHKVQTAFRLGKISELDQDGVSNTAKPT